MKDLKLNWANKVAKDDLHSAVEELCLCLSPKLVRKAKRRIKKERGEFRFFKARDILRVTQLQLPPKTDPLIKGTMKKIEAGKKLGPVILVQKKDKVQIADGFHRISSIFMLDKNADVKCIKVHL